MILATAGGDVDPATVIPDGFDPRPRRPTRGGRGSRPAEVGAPARTGAAAGATAPSAPTPAPSPWEVEGVRRILAHLGAGYRDDYDNWLRVGMALRQLGDAGLHLWHEWSAESPKYEAESLDAKWAGFAAGAGAGRVSLGTLYHLAGLEGWARPCRVGGPAAPRPRQDRDCDRPAWPGRNGDERGTVR